MADNSFRPFRRDASPRDADVSRDGGDPLAELARLIGQGDPNGQPRDSRQDDRYEDVPPSSDLDWGSGDNGYAEQREDDGYAPRAEGYRSNQSDTVPWPGDPEYDDEPAPPSQYSWPPAALAGGAHEEPRSPPPMQEPRHREEPRPPAMRQQPASYLSAAPDSFRPGIRDQAGPQGSSYSEEYAEDEEYEEAPPRRSGTVVILAVLGLAVIGTAGAFAYRAMFGGSIAPSLPPIIRPSDGAIKIQPGPQGATPNQAENNNSGSGEQMVTRQEQPVDLPPGNTAPRVITTIPVVSNSGDGGLPAPQSQGGPSGSVAPGQVFPPPPTPAPNAQPPAYANGGPSQMTAPTAPPSGGTHSVQTLTIRTDQGGTPRQTAAPGPPPAVAAPRPSKPHIVAKPRPAETGAGGPLSIVPNQQGEAAPPPRMRTAMAHPQGSAAPVDLSEGAPSGGGSYAVQVSSQRSEAEAQAAYRSLQARYPQQLGGRHALIRRADLGARGIYYRALVGPFASSEQAAGLCSSIKAAGGSCLIQRN